ncbi:MAG TPA: hypothetical protein VMF86_17555 [Stellaceae bacterium]|nr:hypothetical protein [Stellaceae bacterium]
MKKCVWALASLALVTIAAAPPGRAAHRCALSSTAEAEQAIRYLTDLMVASSACRNTVYAEFALRNRVQIIRYQRAMIRHLHGTGAFDRWDTTLANEAAERQATVPPAQFCRAAQPLLQQAAALDASGFRAYASARAASADPSPRCRR